jgi:hypothetical protein
MFPQINIILEAISGLSLACFNVKTVVALLHTLSDGAEVAGIPRNFLASLDKIGY